MGDKTIIRTDFDEGGPLPPGLLVQLTFLSGPLQGKVEKLYKRQTVLGRSSGDIVINDTAISKEHVMIGFEDGRLFVRDMNSTNGTLLNGGQVWEAFLNNNDEVTLGSTVIRVEIRQTAASASWADLGMVDSAPKQGVSSGGDTNPMQDRAGKNPLDGPAPPGAKAGLQVTVGLDAGLKFVLRKRGTIIGRGENADVDLTDMNVSRNHASIEFMSPERVIIKDMRSMNGTFLNGRWISVSNLTHGDVIKVGNTEIKVFLQLPG